MKAGNRKTLEGVKNFMEKRGYTGLYFPGECGCRTDDLMPCGIDDWSECCYGYVRPCTEEEKGEYAFMVSAKKQKEEK